MTEKVRQLLLSDLLAVMHGDGGHYENKHGTEKAVEDAIVKYHSLISENDELKYKLKNLKGNK